VTNWLDEILADGEHATRLRSDLPYFSESALRIRPKTGALMPLILNEAQRKLHAIAEAQKAKTGKVRIIVCKARQLGISSYISARLFHRILHSPGYRAFVIAHEKVASKNIYEMSRRTSPTNSSPASARQIVKASRSINWTRVF
jgi:hypothetical protein